MVNRREFLERFGDPASLVFRGQFYHSSTFMKCALCGHNIRNVYTLLSHRRPMPIGECCFSLFKKWNSELHTRLLAAQILLDAYDEGINADVKTFNTIGDVDHRLREWRKLKRQALQRVREYKRATGSDWLPKSLYDLKAEAVKKPGKTRRWFDNHIPALLKKVESNKNEYQM